MAIGSKSLRGSLVSEDSVAAFGVVSAARLALAEAQFAVPVSGPQALAANPTPATADAVLFAVSGGVNEANATSDDGIVKVGIDNGASVGSGLARLFSGIAGFHNLVDLALDVDHGKYFVVDTDYGRTNRILSGNLSDLASGAGPTLTQVFATDGEGESIANIEINTVTQKIYWIDGDLTGQFDGGFQLYSADYNGGNVRAIATITPDTNPDPFFGFAAGGSDFAIDQTRGVAYVVSSLQSNDDGSIYQNHILRIDLASGAISFLDLGTGEGEGYHDGRLDPALGVISAIDVDQATGAVYFATQEGQPGSNGGVYRYVPGAQAGDTVAGALTQLWLQPADSAFSTPQGFPTSLIQGIEFDESTGRYYLTTAADATEYNASIFVGSSAGGAPTLFQQVTAPTSGGSLFGMEIDHAATFNGSAGTAYVEQGEATNVFAAGSVSVTDPENTMLKGATVAVSGGFVAGDYLNVTNAFPITGSYNTGTGVLTLLGNATLAQYQTMIQAITFSSLSDNPGASRTISVTLNDGLVTSDPYTVTLGVTAVNDAPVNAVPGAQTMAEDSGALVFSTGNGRPITVSDIDVGGGNLQVTLSAQHGSLTLGGTAGLTFTTGDGTNDATLTFQGTAAAINTALNGLSYAQVADYNGSDAITITTSDLGNTGTDGAKSDTDTVAITITPVADIANDSFDVFSGQQATLNVLANDAFEGSVTLSSSSGPQNGTLAISGTAVLYTADAGYSGADSFTYTVTSGGVTETATVTLNVIDVNDAPTVTATAGNPSYRENASSVALFSNFTADTVEQGQLFTELKLTVSNVDAGHDALTIGGSRLLLTDGAQSTANGITATVALAGTTATVTFSSAGTSAAVLNALVGGLGYEYVGEAPSSADRVVTITSLTDNGGTANGGDDTATLAIASTVTVVPVNDAPTTGDVLVTTDEDVAYTFSTSDFSFSDADGDTFTTLQLVAVSQNGVLYLSRNGAPSIALGAGDTVSVAAIEQGRLSFVPTADFSGAASFTFRVGDDGGTANGGDDQSATGIFTLDVVAVNDAPTIAVPAVTATVSEDGTVVFSAANGNAIAVGDVDSTTLTVTLTANDGTLSLASSAGLTVTTTGSGLQLQGSAVDLQAALDAGVTFTPVADFNGSVTLSAQVSDGADSDNSGTSFTVAAAADASADSFTVKVGSQTTLDVLANDTFSNPDRAISAVGPATHGTVTIDDNGTAGDLTDDSVVYTADASYEGLDTFTYTVTSGGVTETQTVTVQVDPLNFPPQISATAANPTFVEDGAVAQLFSGATVDDDGAITQLVFSVANVETGYDSLVIDGIEVRLIGGLTTLSQSFTANVAVSGTTATVTVSFSGLSELETALLITGLGFRNASNDPAGTSRVITIVSATDDSGMANATALVGASSTVTIQAVDDAPTAVNDTATVAADTPVGINVVANDTDVDGGTKQVVTVNGTALVNTGDTVTLASGAILTLAVDGTLTYDANHAFDALVSSATRGSNTQATDTFSYALNGGSSATVTVTVNGVDGPGDQLLGTAGTDRLRLVGNPVLIDGGAGDDTLAISGGQKFIVADGQVRNVERFFVDGGSTLNLTAVDDTLGALISRSEAGETARIFGTRGDDRIFGGAGADELGGFRGDDIIAISATPTSVNGGLGFDTLVVRSGAHVTLTDTNFTTMEAVRIENGAGADLSGVSSRLSAIRLGSANGGHSEVLGTSVRDTIFGGAGDDFIMGGLGGDRLTGGAGRDTFAYASVREISAKEEILDFQHGVDTINLSLIDADKRLDGDQAFSFIGSAAFTGTRGGEAEVRFEDVRRGVLRVEFDLNHDAVADYSMTVHATTLTASDFVL